MFPWVAYSVNLLMSFGMASSGVLLVRSLSSPKLALSALSWVSIPVTISSFISSIIPSSPVATVHDISIAHDISTGAGISCMVVISLPKRLLNSIGYMVLRMKNVVNPSPIKSTTKSNIFTHPFGFGWIVVVGIVGVVWMMGDQIIGGSCVVCCIGVGVSNLPSPAEAGLHSVWFPFISRGPSVAIGVGVVVGGVVPSIASRSNVFGCSEIFCGCGSVFASGANPPALACHSSSSIIFLSASKEDDVGSISHSG